MSNAVKERPSTDHPPERRALLKRGHFSEGTELSAAQADLLDALPADAPVAQIESIVKGEMTRQAPRRVKIKYPAEVKAAYERALKLTGTPEQGGPKYPLTVKQTDAVKRALASKAKATAEYNAALEKHASNAALKKIAQGKADAPKAAVVAVREFLKAHVALRDDRTMYARKGAAIVLAWREAE
jgi:anti-sigma factor ChrR (cupin superfamily)